MVKIAINGVLGRMGNRILNLAYQSPDFKIVGAFEHEKHAFLGKSIASVLGLGELSKLKITELSGKTLKGSDVLIDFSGPEGTQVALQAALKAKAGIVIGTTGITKKGEHAIKEASKKIPVLYAPNMSVGANFLFDLARLGATKLKAGYDIEIIEAHHRLKKDAPSGTAKRIAEVIAEAKGWDLEKVARYGREGMTGERTNDELGIHVIRGGDIVGEHTVIFAGAGEQIEITHRAQSRDAFARGALVAALFLAKKKKVSYTMADVLKS